MASKVTRDHHNLRRNLNLNDNWVSNDGGDEGIRITDAGLVGIGITPAATAHIYHASNNNVLRLESGDASAGVEFKDNSTTNLPSIYNVTDDLVISTGGAESIRIKTGGNVGIGTNDPLQPLHVEGAEPVIAMEDTTGGATAVWALRVSDGDLSINENTGGGGAHDSYAKRVILDANSRISLSNNDSGTSNTIFGKSAGASLDAGSNYNTFIGEAVSDASMNDALYNTGVGYQALSALTTGEGNTCIGMNSGLVIAGGEYNTIIGQSAGATTTAAQRITAIGVDACNRDVTTAAIGTVAVGYAALNLLTEGIGNVAIGYQAMDANVTSDYNTAVGTSALGSVTADGSAFNSAFGYNAAINLSSGTKCTAIGADAMGSGNVQGSRNTAVGQGSGYAITTGDDNCLIGQDAGVALTTAKQTVFIGAGAGKAVTVTGGSNEHDGTVGIGYNALTALTSGQSNLAIGKSALVACATSDHNVAIGDNALAGVNGNGTGGNTAIGYRAGISTTDGVLNTIIGDSALYQNAQSDRNVAVGYAALYYTSANSVGANVAVGTEAGFYNGTGQNNTYIGHNSGMGTTTANQSNNTAVGKDALKVVTDGSDNVAIGNGSLDSLTSGGRNVCIGSTAGSALTTNAYNTTIGYGAFATANLGEEGNVVIGYAAGDGVDHADSDGNVLIGQSSGTGGAAAMIGCIAIGKDSMNSTAGNAQTGTIAIGLSALTALTSGVRNTVMGYYAANALTQGDDNVIIGYQALNGATTTDGIDQNVAIGNSAMSGTNAGSAKCVAIGYQSLAGNMTAAADANTVVGYEAGQSVTSGGDNTCVGKSAGDLITTGSSNTYIGQNADASANSVDNETAIGHDAVGQGTNSVTLGDGNVTAVYMSDDSGATVHCLDVKPTGAVLHENLLTNSGFDVWSNSTLENVGSDLILNGTFTSDYANWSAGNGALLTSDPNGQDGNGLRIVNGIGAAGFAYQTVTLVVGKLYRIIAYHENYNGEGRILVGNAAQNGNEVSFTNLGDGDFEAYTGVFEAAQASTVVTLGVYSGTSGELTYFDTVSLYEVTPGCVGSNALAPDGWWKEDTADIWRQEPHATYTKDGSYYSLKLTAGSTNDFIAAFKGGFESDDVHVSRFAGRTATMGIWAWTATGSHARIKLSGVGGSGSDTYSSYHTGGSGWEWLEVTKTFASDITSIYFYLRANVNAATVWYSHPMLVFGSSIGEGNYTRPQGEIVICEKMIRPLSGVTPAAADDKILNLEALSSGMIPKGAKALECRVGVLNSSITTGQGVAFGRDSTYWYAIVCNPIVDNVEQTAEGFLPCDANGDVYQNVSEAGATLSTLSMDVTAVHLR